MKPLVSISEMAKLHGISRQTLIYYDEIDLFKPVRVEEETGYRYYSWRQIPFLREICFLKSIGVPLKEIVRHFQGRNAEHEAALLKDQKKRILAEIAKLNKSREAICQRLSAYEEAVDANETHMNEPFLRDMTERKVLFQEYVQPIGRENLHLTLMCLWRQLFEKETVPSGGFGSILRREGVLGGEPLRGAGSCVFLPQWGIDDMETMTLPGGLHACMYKYGMPYDPQAAMKLVAWIHENGYEAAGDVVDVCLLDTTFYQSEATEDFCLLQIPVRKA